MQGEEQQAAAEGGDGIGEAPSTVTLVSISSLALRVAICRRRLVAALRPA
jgi:hypothetical protein